MEIHARHVREHNSLLADPERRLLVWIARRLPPMVTSDALSALSLVAMAFAGASFVAYRWSPWAALVVVAALAANWFGDSLDGTVARVRRLERPRYGYYVDHAIDLAGTSMMLAGLACSPLMAPTVALALLSAFLLVAAESYLAAHSAGVFRLSFLGVGPTELRIMLAAGAVAATLSPTVTIAGDQYRFFDVAGLVGTIGLGVTFITAAIRNGSALRRE